MASVDSQATRSTLLSVDTTLSENINATQNYIPVASTTNFSTSVVAEIESTNEVVSFDTITNQLIQSTDDLATNKILTRISLGLNAGTDPNGTNTGIALIPTIDNNTHRLDLYPSGGLGTNTYTFSVYGKQNGYSGLSLVIAGLSANGTTIFNLANGTITSTGSDVTSASMENVGNGWYRCASTITLASVPLANASIGVGSDDSTFIFSGNTTDSILIWGPQLEISSSATGFLPNPGTASSYPGLTTVTRGVNGTTAQAASSGDSIQQLPFATPVDIPVRLRGLSVSPDGTGAARLTLCDNNGDSILDIDTPDGKVYTMNMPEDGLVFPNGVFISNTDNVTAYTLFTEKFSGEGLTHGS